MDDIDTKPVVDAIDALADDLPNNLIDNLVPFLRVIARSLALLAVHTGFPTVGDEERREAAGKALLLEIDELDKREGPR